MDIGFHFGLARHADCSSHHELDPVASKPGLPEELLAHEALGAEGEGQGRSTAEAGEPIEYRIWKI